MHVTLFVDGYFCNPFDATCLVALEEKGVEYSISRALLRDNQGFPAAMYERTPIARVPTLAHGEFWLSESLAIAEYLEDVAPPQPLLFPGDPRGRARTRQVMAWLRIELQKLRSERTFSGTMYPALPYAPLSEAAHREATELFDVITRLERSGELDAWTIAHVDLALHLLRLKPEDGELPAPARRLLDANLARPSLRKYLDHPRPPNPPPDAQRALRANA